MNKSELNNIKILNLVTILKKQTLPESYWILIEDAKTNCEKLIMNGIKDSNDIFELFNNGETVDIKINQTRVNKQYLAAIYRLLKFHSYKPFSLNKINSLKKDHIESLLKLGIKYNGELLIECSTKIKRIELLEKTKISEKDLNNMLCISDLMRKVGIKEIKAILFMQFGIRSLYELGQKDPILFQDEIKKRIEKYNINRAIPTEKEIRSDISWAKIYPRIIKE